MNLFELTEDYLKLLQLAEDPETDPEALADTMEGIEGALEDKLDAYAYVVSQLDGDIATIDTEIKRLQELKKSLSNNKDRVKKNMYASMIALDVRKIKTAKHQFTIAKNGGKLPVVIYDDVIPEDVPDEYRITKYDFDKDAIRAALENGDFIPFAELGERGESLRIK